jgi:hypothetical protein
MLTLPTDLAGLLALGGMGLVCVLAVLAAVSRGRFFAATHHAPEGFPAVMVPRYLFMALAVAVVLRSGDRQALAVLFVGLAGIAVWDAVIYASRRMPFWPHAVAGIAGLAVAAVAWAGL